MKPNPTESQPSLWDRYYMALDRVEERKRRILAALTEANVPHALVGGQAVALWVATIDPAAVRTTKDVDILLNRSDLPRARAAARSAGFDYFEVVGVGMFLEHDDPRPREGVHLVWANEKVRADYVLPSPDVVDCTELAPGEHSVNLRALLLMKLMANREQDRLHVRDMIDVGLVDHSFVSKFPSELAERLDVLLKEQGR